MFILMEMAQLDWSVIKASMPAWAYLPLDITWWLILSTRSTYQSIYVCIFRLNNTCLLLPAWYSLRRVNRSPLMPSKVLVMCQLLHINIKDFQCCSLCLLLMTGLFILHMGKPHLWPQSPISDVTVTVHTVHHRRRFPLPQEELLLLHNFRLCDDFDLLLQLHICHARIHIE